MGGYYERNLSILRHIQPKLASFLSAVVRSSSSSDAPDNILMDATAKRSLGKVPRTQSYNDRPVLYLLGLHPFEEVISCLGQLPSHVRFVVILESDQSLLVSFLDTVPVFDVLSSKRCILAASEETELLDEAVHAAFAREGFVVGRCSETVHIGDEPGSSSRYASLAHAFERALSFQIENLGNSPEDSLLGLRQMALSSPWTLFAHKLHTLENRFTKWPAVVVSAGPSLDKNLHLLKDRENQIVIIAVDTVLEKLLKSSIVPHFVTTLERGSLVFDAHFQRIVRENPPGLEKIVLVVQSVCVPKIAGRWPGPVIVVGKRDIVLDREIVGGLLGGNVIPSGASVSHMGLGLANFLGVPAVALIGQDLAFAEDGRSHTNRTYWDTRSPDEETPREERCRVPAMYGGMVETTRIWRYFIDQFTRIAASMPIPLHNCTEGGALIPGSVAMRFTHFLSENTSVNPLEDVSVLLKQSLDDPTSRKIDIDGFDCRYATLQQSLHRSQRLLDRALASLRSLEEPVATLQRRETLIREVRKTLNELTTKSPILTYIGQAQFASLIAESYTLRDLSDKPTLMKWIRLHRTYLEKQVVFAAMIVGWLLYIDGVRQMMPETMDTLRETTPRAPLLEMCFGSLSGTFREAIILDILLSRAELSDFLHDPAVTEKIARHFMNERRFSEAAGLLSDFLGRNTSLPGERRSVLEVLLASCFMNADLCWPPDYGKAFGALSRSYLSNPCNRDVEKILAELLEKQLDLAEKRASDSPLRTTEKSMKKEVSALRENMRLLRKSPSEALKKLLGVPHSVTE